MASPEASEMEGVGLDLYKWTLGTLSLSRRRGWGYNRLNPPVRKRVRLARLGKRRQRSLKIRRLARFRLSWLSPFTYLAKLRDAYVRLLQAASDKFVFCESASFPALSSAGTATVPFGDFKAKDRELNELLKVYLSRTRTHLILPHDDD